SLVALFRRAGDRPVRAGDRLAGRWARTRAPGARDESGVGERARAAWRGGGAIRRCDHEPALPERLVGARPPGARPSGDRRGPGGGRVLGVSSAGLTMANRFGLPQLGIGL